MKKKKIKKLARLLHKEVETQRREREEKYSIKETSISSQSHVCEYDEEVSNKVFNFILNLIKIQSKLSLDFNQDYINIHCNLNQFRKSNSNPNYPTKEESIEISVNHGGFRIRRDYDNFISFQDENFLVNLKPHLIEKYEQISKETIKEIMDDVLIITNLSRECNLDELLNN